MDAKLDRWRAAMADLMLACAAADANQAAELVNTLDRLLRAAPTSVGIASLPLASSPLISNGDADAAALTLAARLGGYMLSQGRGGPAMATVALGPDGTETHGEGACTAIALVGALASAFAAERNAERTTSYGHSPAASIN